LPPNAPKSWCPTSGSWLCFRILFFFRFMVCCVSYCTSLISKRSDFHRLWPVRIPVLRLVFLT
jgi:hypothetical protein